MQNFINDTRAKVEGGRGGEPLDVAGLQAARASDKAAAAARASVQTVLERGPSPDPRGLTTEASFTRSHTHSG